MEGAVEAGPGLAPLAPVTEPVFTENRGQFGQWSARFYAHGGPFSVALGDGWVAYDVPGGDGNDEVGGTVVRVTFVGAMDTVPLAEGTLGHKNNYLHGQDPAGWVTDVPNHRRIVYRGLWDGIDLGFRFEGGELKYEFIVAPGSDPSGIVMSYEGMDELEICPETGDLLVSTPGATLRDSAPLTYQDDGARRVTVPSAFRLLGDGQVAFELGDYDNRIPLVIDPGMLFCTFLGEGGNDVGNDVAIDTDGCAYVAGLTTSSKFPLTPGAYDTRFDTSEAFVSKFSKNGTSLVYSTFIGGLLDEEATGVAVDDDGLVYLVGTTGSSNFPTTAGAFCTTLSGSVDAFALKLNITGSSLEYSTYIGGGSDEGAKAIGLDANGSLYVAGWTLSRTFPEVVGSFRRMENKSDVFVVKLKADGSNLEYSCVLGGNESESASDLALDDAGCAYIVGWTQNPDIGEGDPYPTTPWAFDWSPGYKDSSTTDGFVTKLSATGRSMEYSTFIGDTGNDRCLGIDVDGQGCAFVVGVTGSVWFPLEPRPPDNLLPRGYPNSFTLKLDAKGGSLMYSKVFSVTFMDEARAVSVDGEGCAYVTGYAYGMSTFPTTPEAFQPKNHSWDREAYVLKLDERGMNVLYASFLGGNNADHGNAVALDQDGVMYITGNTFSTQGFPATSGAYDNVSNASTIGGPLGDAFLCKVDVTVPHLVNYTGHWNATTGDEYMFNLTIADNLGVVGAGLQYWFGTTTNITNLTNITLDLTGGGGRNGSWTATIDIPSNSVEPLLYRAWARDLADLNCTITEHYVRVVDNDAPLLENQSPATGGTGNEFNLSVRAQDNIGVSKVAVLFSPPGGMGLASTGGMLAGYATGQGNGTFNFTVVLPMYTTGPFRYWFWVNDTEGNWFRTDMLVVDVFDDDGPLMIVDPPLGAVTTGQDLEVSVNVRDNIEVAKVQFTWWYDVAGDPERVTLSMGPTSVDENGNGTYTLTFRVPFFINLSFIPAIQVVFSATDGSGNNVTSGTYLLRLRDNDPPWFLENLSDANATTGDPFHIEFEVWDNVALSSVFVRYWFGMGRAVDLPLGRGVGNLWNATITIPHAWTALHYVLGAVDTSGNTNWTRQWDLLVVDNDVPRVVADASDEVTTTGDALSFEVRVEDNLFVSWVQVVYWMGDGERLEVELVGKDLTGGNNGTYHATVVAPSNASGQLAYTVVAMDAVGNVLTTGERYVDVRDNDRPWFGTDLSDGEAWRGETFHLDIEVHDNVDVAELRCEWWFGDGEHLNGSVPQDSALAIEVPREPGGPFSYLFAVRDDAGNWNRSATFGREVLNSPPVIEGLEVWNVTEGEQEELDIREFIVDRDDTDWLISLTSPDSNVTLETHTLHASYDSWVPEYVISVSVSDGRDTTWHNVTVHIVEVNDPPGIGSVWYNGAVFDVHTGVVRFREGRQDVLSVQATDEEGDVLNFSWQVDGLEVATGPELRFEDLSAGDYSVTLEVHDGTDTTSLDIVVSVTEEVEPFASWLWVVLLIVLVVVALAALIIRGSGPTR